MKYLIVFLAFLALANGQTCDECKQGIETLGGFPIEMETQKTNILHIIA